MGCYLREVLDMYKGGYFVTYSTAKFFFIYLSQECLFLGKKIYYGNWKWRRF